MAKSHSSIVCHKLSLARGRADQRRRLSGQVAARKTSILCQCAAIRIASRARLSRLRDLQFTHCFSRLYDDLDLRHRRLLGFEVWTSRNPRRPWTASDGVGRAHGGVRYASMETRVKPSESVAKMQTPGQLGDGEVTRPIPLPSSPGSAGGCLAQVRGVGARVHTLRRVAPGRAPRWRR